MTEAEPEWSIQPPRFVVVRRGGGYDRVHVDWWVEGAVRRIRELESGAPVLVPEPEHAAGLLATAQRVAEDTIAQAQAKAALIADDAARECQELVLGVRAQQVVAEKGRDDAVAQICQISADLTRLAIALQSAQERETL